MFSLNFAKGGRMSEPVMTSRYVAPDWFTRNVFNQIVAALTRLGISVWGSRVLEVRGRKTGKPRRTSVNLLTLEGLTRQGRYVSVSRYPFRAIPQK